MSEQDTPAAAGGQGCSPADHAGHAPLLATVPAPVAFVACFAIGMLLQQVLRLPVYPDGWLAPARIVGTVLANIALLLALAGMGLFARARTTILPSGRASRLVTGGPYRFTRNPMYVSLVLAYLGLALMLDVPWTLPLLALPVLQLQRVMIPFEEARMQALFGEAYLAYRARVRRWL